jgi:hypothetical protein
MVAETSLIPSSRPAAHRNDGGQDAKVADWFAAAGRPAAFERMVADGSFDSVFARHFGKLRVTSTSASGS